jgi:hypothetical protein
MEGEKKGKECALGTPFLLILSVCLLYLQYMAIRQAGQAHAATPSTQPLDIILDVSTFLVLANTDNDLKHNLSYIMMSYASSYITRKQPCKTV